MIVQAILSAAMLAQVGGPTKAAWKVTKSAQGEYSVDLPGKPIEKRRTLKAEGGSVSLTASSSRVGASTFGVAFGDLGKVGPEAALEAAGEELAATSRGEVKEAAEASMGGGPGKELRIEVPGKVVAGGAVTRARILIVGGRLYEVVATVPTAKEAEMAEDVGRFFDSFTPSKSRMATAAAESKAAAKAKADAEALAKAERKDEPGLAAEAGASPPRLVPGWSLFSTPDGACRVALPGTPKATEQSTKNGAGTTLVRIFTVERPGKAIFAFAVVDLPAGPIDAEAAFDAARKGGLSRVPGATLAEEKKIEYLGSPARELLIDLPATPATPGGSRMRTRAILAGGHLIQLMYVQPSRAEPAAAEAVACFFDSLRFGGAATEATGAGAPGKLGPGWSEFAAPGGKFRVTLPGTPQEIKHTAPSPAGPIEIRIYAVERAGRASYLVSMNELPGGGAGNVEGGLDGARSGMLAQVPGAKLESEKKITYRGFPGRELTIALPASPQLPGGAKLVVRVLIAKSRLYQLQSIQPSGTTPPPAEEVAAFFDSLRFADE